MSATRLLAGALLATMALPIGTAAAADYVDLQLVIAVDTSRSMESSEQRLQRRGYVAAFRDEDVLRAISSGPVGRIAVTYVEWADADRQRVVVPWRVLGSAEDALAFSDELSRAPTRVGMRTSISGALLFALDAFSNSGVQSDRRTIDVSGDGANNDGPSLPTARNNVIAHGITINGLPLLIRSTHVAPYPGEFLDEYYEGCVIGGPGSFVVVANGPGEFASAIRRKLVLEIAASTPPTPAVIPVSRIQLQPQVNCLRVDAVNGIFP